MKKRIFLVVYFFISFFIIGFAQRPFSFALLTDLHISATNPQASEDLQMVIDEINTNNQIEFILVSGDVTNYGDKLSLEMAKGILDQLKNPYYIVPGNHEMKWSESGATDFAKIFGDDKFSFTYNDCYFIGFATGPIIKMGDGHVAPQDIEWTKKQLKKIGKNNPIFVVTHYPLLNGDVDNWYEVTDVIRRYNVQAVLGGHYHRNVFLNYDEIPGIVHRSTLRGNEPKGGYSILNVSDSIYVYEKIIGKTARKWLSLPFGKKHYPKPNLSLRPSFAINQFYPNVKEKWRKNTLAAIYTIPAISENYIYYGDDKGYFYCIFANNGNLKWKFKTGNRIISSPAVQNGKVVFGSTDGNIYCLNTQNGNLIWKFTTEKAVLGCPYIQNDTVLIGGSDGYFRALNLHTGNLIWQYEGIKNYIETRPVVANGKVYFGAWDTYFYALHLKDGSLAWKWNNGNSNIFYSPAAVLPVYSFNKIFITAPDRFWTSLDAETGKVVWRTNQHEVRETIGISEDKNTVYSRAMNDSVFAVDVQTNYPKIIWKTNAQFGYDHNPSMLIERNGVIVFGTKNGLLVGINAKGGSVSWKHKIGNSIINTVSFLSSNEFVITTTEGIIARIKF